MEAVGEKLRWIGKAHHQLVVAVYEPSSTRFRLPHYHCYGCGMSGTKTKLIRVFRWGQGYGIYQKRKHYSSGDDLPGIEDYQPEVLVGDVPF